MASKSLGTLTLDLIARVGGFVQGMDAAERRSEKWRRQVEKDAKAVGAAIAAGTAAGATALTALTVATVRQAEEVSRFAALTGTSTDVFQRYAAGAKAAGIEQDKLADIFKDVSDKIGDFLQTGGGPLADFFENIAPKVGVTAEQFRKLSGPQALELYVSSLEKAGASQNDMTFYMEALANDATLLLPLLKNNAQGFRELGDQAAAAGAIMDERTIRAANELAAATQIAGESLTGMRNQLMRGMLPALSGLADELFDVSTNTTLAEEAGRTFGTILKGLTATAVGAYAAFQLAGKGLATVATALDGAELEATDFLFTPLAINKIVDNFGKVKRGFEIGADDLRATALEYAEILRGIWSAGSEEGGGDEEFASRVKKRAALLAELRNAAAGAGVVVATADEKKAQVELWKRTEEAIRASNAALDEWEADERAYRDRLKREGERLTQLIDPQAAFDAEFARLDELLDAGAISWDVYAAAVANAQNALDKFSKEGDDLTKYLKDIENATQQWGRNFEDTIIEAARTGKFEFRDFALSILEDMARIALRKSVIDGMFGTSGWFSGLFTPNANGNAFQGGRVIPFASGGVVDSPTFFPMARGIGLMGEAGPEAIMPLKRGPDGKLGVVAQGGGGVHISVHQTIDARGQGEQAANNIRNSSREMADLIINTVVSDIRRRGAIPSALGAK